MKVRVCCRRHRPVKCEPARRSRIGKGTQRIVAHRDHVWRDLRPYSREHSRCLASSAIVLASWYDAVEINKESPADLCRRQPFGDEASGSIQPGELQRPVESDYTTVARQDDLSNRTYGTTISSMLI